MNTSTKLRMARKGLGGLVGTSYAAGRFVGTARATGRPEVNLPEVNLPEARGLPVVAGVAAGAAGAYFLDPDQGKRRRHIARDKAVSLFRRGAGEARRKAQYAGGKAAGKAQERTSAGRDPGDLNDPALARKVESEIFRGADAPKDKVVVNVEEGIVYLRGEVDSPGQASALAQAARRVEGVENVQSLLHLPSEPAKSKDGQPKSAS
jgi:hypothetical protein